MISKEIEKILFIMEQSLTMESIEEFSFSEYEELFSCHYGLGMWIRNELLEESSALYNEFYKVGIRNRDDMSDLIIKLFYLYVKEKYRK